MPEIQSLDLGVRGYVLELGRNRFEGAGQALLENPEVKRLYLGYDAAVHTPRGDETARGDAIPGPGQTAG